MPDPDRPDTAPEMGRLHRLVKTAALPGVTEGTHYDRPALQVMSKTFVTLREPGIMVLMAPLEHKELLLEIAPDIYFQTAHFEGWPALMARLDRIADDELTVRLIEAWRHKAPKRLAADYAKASLAQTGR